MGEGEGGGLGDRSRKQTRFSGAERECVHEGGDKDPGEVVGEVLDSRERGGS